MTDLRELIQSALPEALGGLIATAVALMCGWLWKLVRRRARGAETPSTRRDDGERRRGRAALVVGSIALLGFALLSEFVGPALSGRLVSGRSLKVISARRWVTYDPQGNWEWSQGIHFDLSSSTSEVDLTRRELGWIRRAGFDGIITFTSRGRFAAIPRLAKEEGLAVIMGVWEPRDAQEVMAAIAQRDYVDAYCVGHNGLGDSRYSIEELTEAVGYIRFHSGRPVSTTEKLGFYLSHKELLSLGDWVFPDAHVSVKEEAGVYRADAARDTRQVIEWSKLIAAQPEREGKPVLLKMVAYPMSGISNASLEEQASFFVSLFESRRDVMPYLPSDVSVSVHSAFDMPWKTKWPFYEWEPYAGLLNDDGTPRPAAQEIVKRLP
jgi:exo-beta-1,3-glucanase (GH17 family)